MTEINRIKNELAGLLVSLNTEHEELEKTKDEIRLLRSEETLIKNNIVGLSKKIKALQDELGDYLEE